MHMSFNVWKVKETVLSHYFRLHVT
jgi:hypothetical protein